MNIDIYVTPFLAHAKRAWEDILGLNFFPLGTLKTTGQGTTEDVTIITPIRGSLNGEVFYGFNTETAKSVASLMLSREVDELDEEAFSVLEKLASVISGNAVAMLSMGGYECRTDPPQIVQSKDSQDFPGATTQIQASFNSGVGILHMKFSLVESQDNMRELAELQHTYRR